MGSSEPSRVAIRSRQWVFVRNIDVHFQAQKHQGLQAATLHTWTIYFRDWIQETVGEWIGWVALTMSKLRQTALFGLSQSQLANLPQANGTASGDEGFSK